MPRKAHVSFVLTCIVMVVVLSCCKSRRDWIMFRGNQGQGTTPNAVYPPLGLKWKLELQLDSKKASFFNPPVVLGNTIFFGSTDGNFYALDVNSGYMHWVYKTSAAINSIPFADKDNVYFGSNDGFVYAVSQKDGQEKWSFDTGHTVQSTVTRYKDWIVFTSDVGATYLLSPQGVEQHRIPNLVWLYHTFQIYEDIIYFAPGPTHNPRSFGAYDIKAQVYLWTIETAKMNANWYSFPALKGDLLFYSTATHRGRHWELTYYGLDRLTGDDVWIYSAISNHGILTEPPLLRELLIQNTELLDFLAPSLWKNLVIYTSGDAVVRAFHMKDGTLAWRQIFDYPTSSAPTIAGNRIYFGLKGDLSPASDTSPSRTQSPKLVCLNARDGKQIWEIDVEGELLSAPVVAGKWIIFGTSANLFYVLEEVY